MSIVPYPSQIDDKPAYIFSNPASSGRNNGTVRIGLYDETTDSFNWKYSQIIHPGKYQYSSIAIMPNGEIGILYEGDQPNIRFVRMTVDWITAPRNSTTFTSINNVTMDKKDGSVIFQVEFSRPMIKMGSPVLKLKVGGTSREAEYVSGKAESIYRFSYTPKQGESEIEVINVSGKGTSYIGDLFNELSQDVSFRFSLNTVPDTDEPLRADGSMESSQWFRYQDRWYDFWNKGYMAINSMMRGNY